MAHRDRNAEGMYRHELEGGSVQVVRCTNESGVTSIRVAEKSEFALKENEGFNYQVDGESSASRVKEGSKDT